MGNIFGKKKLDGVQPRIVVINQPKFEPHEHQSGHPKITISNSNLQKTTKYTALTFVPFSLLGQFRRMANVFFLIQTIIMMVGYYTELFRSPLSPWSMLGVLLAVLAVTMALEGRDDYFREMQDREVNKRIAKTLKVSGDSVTEVKKKWKDVAVGDIVVVDDKQPIPADLILLTSSRPQGNCYVETSNIDGETNLKLREPPRGLAEILRGDAADLPADLDAIDVKKLQGHATVNQPNASITSLQGKITIEVDGKQVDLPLNSEQLLLRGSTIQNSVFVIGLVCYTGEETKVALNKQPTPSKVSSLENLINKSLWVVIAGLLILTSICTILAQQWKKTTGIDTTPGNFWYIYPENKANTYIFPSWLADWLAFFIILNNAVPINLYVTMEFCHLAQGLFVSNDPAMKFGTISAKMRTSNLCHELGVIDYIFSDKTGTLTQNVMETRYISAGNEVVSVAIGATPNIEVIRRNADYRDVLIVMSVAHTTMIGHQPNPDGSLNYQAESPDEKALVEAAARMGFKYIKRSPHDITIINPLTGSEEAYRVLAINQFDSTRKRMSMIIREPSGSHALYIKGADNVILERQGASSKDSVNIIQTHLDQFAKEGLRTLVYAKRDLSDGEVQSFLEAYQKASVAIDNRRDELARVAESIEKDLHILGASAIEDKLQDGVPDAIADLSNAGIKIWVLTGDKLETAINIGYSCKLLTPDMDLNIFAISEKKFDKNESASTLFQEALEKLEHLEEELGIKPNSKNTTSVVQIQIGADNNNSSTQKRALVITGEVLALLFADISAKDRLREAARRCDAVLACRVSPLQKAEIVKLIRYSAQKPITLAIGDGANDVSMIQASHIGVGINGLEGLQAANSADVAIGQFRFLKRLLLVHGAWNQQRMTKVINYVFLKNFTIASTIFAYTILSGYSGTPLYEEWLYTGFNLFTFFLIIGVGILDQHVRAPVAMNVPQLYKHVGAGVTPFTMILTIIRAATYTILIVLWPYLAYPGLDGLQIGGLYAGGLLVYTGMIFSIQTRAMFISTSFTFVTLLLFLLGFGLFFIFIFVYSVMKTFLNSWSFYLVAFTSMAQPLFWVVVFGVLLSTVYFDFLMKYFQREFFPSSLDSNIETSVEWTRRQHEAEKAIGATPPEEKPSMDITVAIEAGPNVPKPPKVPIDLAKIRRRSQRKLARAKMSFYDLFFLQQLKTFRVSLTPDKTIYMFGLIAIYFFVFGVIMYASVGYVKTLTYEYDNGIAGSSVNTCPLGSSNCLLSIKLKEEMTFPIILSYGLTNFYQNHFRYTTSKVDTQLLGGETSQTNIEFYCNFLSTYPRPEIFPCGLQAMSMFNDTFTLDSSQTGLLKINQTSSLVGWPAADKNLFANPSNYPGVCDTDDVDCLNEVYPNIVTRDEGVKNKRFHVWMRLAGLSWFQKPYGTIEPQLTTKSLLAGDSLLFRISNVYPVSSFNGTKSIVLVSGLNWYGSSDTTLAKAFFIMGGISLGSAILVYLKERRSPRKLLLQGLSDE